MKGYMTYHRKAKKRFHGIAMYVADHLCDTTMRIPDEDEELETIHILLKKTNPNISIIGCYLDVESRADNVTIERVWSKLLLKVRTALGRGEGVILMGDLNRPLQTPRPSFGTKLLLDWAASGIVSILNDKNTHTRIDPSTGRGSTLDLGVVSENIHKLVTSFEVDTNRECSARKRPPARLHCR